MEHFYGLLAQQVGALVGKKRVGWEEEQAAMLMDLKSKAEESESKAEVKEVGFFASLEPFRCHF